MATMAERLPGLIEAMCRNEQYQCKSEDGVFRMNTTQSHSFAEVFLDKLSIFFKQESLLCIPTP